jgi:hypothetical protein
MNIVWCSERSLESLGLRGLSILSELTDNGGVFLSIKTPNNHKYCATISFVKHMILFSTPENRVAQVISYDILIKYIKTSFSGFLYELVNTNEGLPWIIMFREDIISNNLGETLADIISPIVVQMLDESKKNSIFLSIRAMDGQPREFVIDELSIEAVS